jgi:NAD(P)-dependent dehydrogenase (short-subunit alcohol dehydrogenase family)
MALAREGASVALAARSANYLDEVAAAITDLGGRALAVPTDVTDRNQCANLVSRAGEEFGGVDVLVNSAFRPDVFKTFEAVDLDRWREIFDVNVFGSLQLTQAALPALKDTRGAIVFINSMASRKPPALQAGYAASKGALLVAAKALAQEFGPYGVRVNSVVPGWMLGPPVQMYLDYTSAKRGITTEEVAAEITASIPLGEIPPQESVAEAVVFFASDMAAMITGQTLDVNGGEVFH